jgi:hypothetical protein
MLSRRGIQRGVNVQWTYQLTWCACSAIQASRPPLCDAPPRLRFLSRPGMPLSRQRCLSLLVRTPSTSRPTASSGPPTLLRRSA